MSREEIIRMAREAGMTGLDAGGLLENFERFAALVAAAEREACALLCESRVEPQTVNYRTRRSMAIKNKNGARNGCADAIRARGNDE